MATSLEYHLLIEDIKTKYDLLTNKEHDHIQEFFEGSIPIFKIMYGHGDIPDDNKILVSFHLSLNSVDAIQWYLRLSFFHKDLYLTECYYKDDYGETYLGQSAEVVKYCKDEQKILKDWLGNEKETKEYINKRISGRERPNRKKGFVDHKEAELEFNTMQEDDEENYH